jgi:hypothetical protein
MAKKKTPETILKDGIKKLFGSLSLYYVSMAPAFAKCPKCGHGFTRHGVRTGVPDLLVCYQGRFYGVEVKAGKNKPSPEQIEQLRLIELAGGVAVVVRSYEELQEAFQFPGRLFP